MLNKMYSIECCILAEFLAVSCYRALFVVTLKQIWVRFGKLQSVVHYMYSRLRASVCSGMLCHA